MTTKHTPGPWRVNPKAGEVRGADWNVIVADVFPVGGDVFVRDANARLIAAAPELLHVAEMVLRGAADGALYGFAEAAVRKAKGKP